jgi:hypothetical protein
MVRFHLTAMAVLCHEMLAMAAFEITHDEAVTEILVGNCD